MTPSAGLRLILAASAAGCGLPAPAQPPSPPIPVELQPYVPRNLSTYFVGFLTGEGRQITHEMFIRHEAYMRRQFEAGLYHVAGPLTDGGTIHGIVIVSAPTKEAASALIAADPVVQEGGFTVEVHPALLPDLSAVRAEYPPPAH